MVQDVYLMIATEVPLKAVLATARSWPSIGWPRSFRLDLSIPQLIVFYVFGAWYHCLLGDHTITMSSFTTYAYSLQRDHCAFLRLQETEKTDPD